MTILSFGKDDAKDTLKDLLTNYLGHRLSDEHHPFAVFSVIILLFLSVTIGVVDAEKCSGKSCRFAKGYQ